MKRIILTIIMFIIVISPVKALEGIDVSEYQGKIDFIQVKSAGIEVVYIRSSAGNSYKDKYFEQNYEHAKNSNLKIGFYHYVTARNIKEAEEQAIFFAKIIANKAIDCPLAMDFEYFKGLTNTEVNEISKTFLETLTRLTNKELIIYSDAYNARYVFDAELAQNYPLWIAEYEVKEPEISKWSKWTGWQYTDHGRIPGINGNVDRDIFTESILINDNNPVKEPEVPPTNQTKIIYYCVKYGDTLSKIAKEYNISITEIINQNNIKNPNRIYPNEIIKITSNYQYQLPTSKNNQIYIVKPGDTLSTIANKFQTTVKELATINHIKNPNLIYPGEKINITSKTNNHMLKYLIQKNDTLSAIALYYHTTIRELVTINHIKNPNLIYPNNILYIPEENIY